MTRTIETDRQKAAKLLDQIADMGPAMAYHTLAGAIAEIRRKAFAEAAAIAAREEDAAEAIRQHAGIEP